MNSKRLNGEGSWGTKHIRDTDYVRYTKTYHGKRKEFYGRTKKEVLGKVQKYEMTINTAAVQNDLQKKMFSSYCGIWLKTEKYNQLAPKTYDSYEGVIESLIKPSKIGNMQIKVINKSDPVEIGTIITNFLNDLTTKYAKSYINTTITILSQVSQYGIKRNCLSYDIMKYVSKPTITQIRPQKKIVVLDIKQVHLLWDEMLRKNTETSFIQGQIGEYVYGLPSLVLLFLCYTGMRSGEVTALKWHSINMEDRYIEIDEQVVQIKNRNKNKDNSNNFITLTTPTKNKKKRVIPLSNRAYEILLMVKQRFPGGKANDIVFSKTGKPISNSSLNRCLHQMAKRAGLPNDLTVHALRHSFASILLNEDTQSLYTVSNILGHSSTDITYRIYIDIFMKNKAKTINLFDKIDNEYEE